MNKTGSSSNENGEPPLIGGVHGRSASSINHSGGILVSLSCESSEAEPHLPTSAWQAGATRQGRHSEKDFVAEHFFQGAHEKERNKVKTMPTME